MRLWVRLKIVLNTHYHFGGVGVERDPQKISAVLADPTRYSIYQWILSHSRAVGATETAARFGVHANVARMHLSRLVEVGLLAAHAEKTGRGGRPGYLYEPSGNAISLTTVPAREFQLLADLLVQALALMGENSKEAVAEIGRTFGRRLGREASADLEARDGAADQHFQSCAAALQRLGVQALAVRTGEGQFSIVLRTCGFREVATAHPDQVCHLCKAMVEGITEVCLEAGQGLVRAASLPAGDAECVYEVDGLIRLE